ncbi:hypothetical protein VE01_08028 [Pseudogymnoascus verrucosus]|uniref:DNA mismatch repair protein PMS1 n=1 Tax=Pseudogymnoascus verrucosus TaxID=342668 RepID=A0A1B8GCR8_9PEZI|nr:uncharacterized protein VE01_08028 [Pseudogymnoascus verrucosus]OBT93628.1 hypothetical protein VE01_08028 [Pseudogymnoascus verrucosus]
MATIKAIEGRTIHQIQSGQVIVDLCSVVKELVENSLDAGASSIEVRFKNQGLESIEVHDNGAGITSQNYETIALKHYTSKLSTYADLTTLHTFGFRGEALSSLCALSDFTITTCTAEDAPKGTKLDFEVSGKLKGTSVVAAQKGTTVTVENLFNNLPVRRRELERNIKREWNRVVTVLGQYACIQTGVKINVTQQAGKGRKTTVFATKGNPTTRENIANVFGAKTLVALVPLDLNLELEPSSGPSQRWSTQDDDGTKEIRIVGHISKPISGEGRQLPDKQMFFVNSRPCGLPQVAKAFNEVYKSYNNNQSPFIFANIELDTHLYDVNVSPDKRTIMLHEQNSMLEQLKLSLTELFEKQDYAVPVSQLSSQKQPAYKQLTINREPPSTPSARPTAPAMREVAEETDEESAPGEDQSIGGEDEQAGEPRNGELEVREESRDVANRDRGAIDLMAKWHEAKTKDRAIQGETRSKARTTEKADGPSKDKLRLSKRLSREGEMDDEASDIVGDDGSEHGSADEMPDRSHQLPVPVRDFNARLAEAEHGGQEANGYKPPRPISHDDHIPSLASPTRRPAPGTGSIISKHVRPRRMSEETATITIGDHTTVSSIGTPRPKKRRLEPPSSNVAQQDSTPSFGSRLSQRFAAHGADIEQIDSSMDQDEESVGEEIEEEQDEGVEEEEELEEEVGEAGEEEEYPEGLEMEHSSEMEPEEPVEAPAEEYEEEILDEGGNEMDTAEDLASMVDNQDGDYMDEEDKKALEDAKVQEMIKAAEEVASRPSADNEKRANSLLKNDARRKDATVHLVKNLNTTVDAIAQQMQNLNESLVHFEASEHFEEPSASGIDSVNAEEKLSLTIHKSDFAKMKIIGQFNLGFILASRTSHGSDSTNKASDDVFIIDQHASDEKYNFERLQASTTVQSQRLVQPKPLSLTAVEEEIVIEHLDVLETNGFLLSIDHDAPVGERCHLVALPLSRETTFSLSDLEELIVLLTETPPGQIPRPSKVRKMFAMRACRSSVMIGRTLTTKQMAKLVGHMGEIDKPWNCPHGRPTMRHLCGLGGWDEEGWKEGQGVDGDKDGETDWNAYVRRKKRTN